MTVILFILVLLVLIIGHEFGHFTVAKWLKMKVLEFGVGFPPKIFGKKFKEDGTEYTVNWLPFGGFVRIFGEDPSANPESEATSGLRAEDAMYNKPKLHQALVLFAGPFANILLAVLFSTTALMIGTLSIIDTENAPQAGDVRVLIGEVLPGSPAETAGVRAGATITGIEAAGIHYAVENPEQVSALISNSDGPVTLIVSGKDGEQSIDITPTAGLVEGEPERKVVGISTALVGTLSYPIHIALWRAIVDTAHDFVFILVSLVTLIGSAFTLSADVSQITGPVGIATLTGDAAALGFGALLSFAALLSTNLAVINLLPFPALDGGRLLFLGLETIFRRKIPTKTAQVVNAAGFAILILLMLAVTAHDIFRLIG